MADPSHHGGSPLSRPPSCALPLGPLGPGQFFEICPARQLFSAWARAHQLPQNPSNAMVNHQFPYEKKYGVFV